MLWGQFANLCTEIPGGTVTSSYLTADDRDISVKAVMRTYNAHIWITSHVFVFYTILDNLYSSLIPLSEPTRITSQQLMFDR